MRRTATEFLREADSAKLSVNQSAKLSLSLVAMASELSKAVSARAVSSFLARGATIENLGESPQHCNFEGVQDYHLVPGL